MNLDKKLELAHGYAVANNSYSSDAWAYADAMEAEYNKRKQAETEKNAKQSKILFDDLNKNESGSCQHIITSLDRTWCFDCGGKLNNTESSQLELQPDWSVAPERATAWKIDDHGVPMWLQSHNNINQPYVWLSDAPDFDYQGDWKDSLRIRPK